MKIDLHTHTIYSKAFPKYGSIIQPKELIKTAIRRGLDGVAITDYENITGAKVAQKLARKIDRNFKVIIGEEIRTNIGHILALNIQEQIGKKNFREVIDEIREQDGVAVIAHPFTPIFFCRCKLDKKELKIFDGIEVINSLDLFNNGVSLKVANKLKLGITAGSDSHNLRSIGLAYTICNDIGDIKKRKTEVIGDTSSLTCKFLTFYQALTKLK